MTQIEDNAGLSEGMAALYLSRGGMTYKAQIIRLHAHECCDLRVFNMPGVTVVYKAAYDSDGQERHSWRKQTDVPITSEIHKERCPVDGTTQFYYTDQGISYRCRRCRAVHITPWPTILGEYSDLCGDIVPQD